MSKDLIIESIKLFLDKANTKMINGIVLTIGVIIIFVILIFAIIIIRKTIRSFNHEQDYIKLLKIHTEANEMLRLLAEQYEKLININNSTSKLFCALNKLIFNRLNGDDNIYKFNELIEAIIYQVPSVLKSSLSKKHRCVLWIPTKENNNLTTLYASSTELQNKSFSINKSFVGRVFLEGEIHNCGNVIEESTYDKKKKNKIHYKSLAGIPIKINNEVVAVLTIDGKEENSFSDEDIDNLYIYSQMISLCMLFIKEKHGIINLKEEAL
ncbi:GAF domain-containing protein [Maledivibacter halophilus]|nr:GAF domain-containing protein [Maledivibacter halophilus]